jgi:hypothetical protein
MVRTINAASLLAAWEAAASLPISRRPTVLLASVLPERSADEWAERPLGERDNALLRLRESLFGSRLDTIGYCVKCGETMEAQLRTGDLRMLFAGADFFDYQAGSSTVRFRVPSDADLTAALESQDPRRMLLQRCVPSFDQLDPTVINHIIAAMAECDPQADVQIQLSCPACGEPQSLSFDIGSYLWSDLSDWARRLLADVHALASAYGWSEADILGMSAFRRRLYLQMIARPS